MRVRAGLSIALSAFVLSIMPAFAQTASPATPAPAAPKAVAAAPKAAREPTAGQMAARERQRRCGVEWKEAKTAGKTAGAKWPQFWSRCNARLKGNSA